MFVVLRKKDAWCMGAAVYFSLLGEQRAAAPKAFSLGRIFFAVVRAGRARGLAWEESEGVFHHTHRGSAREANFVP